jgi:hypothetical protein
MTRRWPTKPRPSSVVKLLKKRFAEMKLHGKAILATTPSLDTSTTILEERARASIHNVVEAFLCGLDVVGL